MVDFHRALSDETVSNRYFQVLKLGRRVAHERLSRICFIDYDRDMVLVADRRDPETGSHEILGVGRLGRRTSNDEAEFALVVRDSFQGRGLGKALLQKLIKIGRDEGVQKIVADILARNQAMQRVCLEFGFRLRTGSDPTLIRAELDLAAEQPST